MSKLCENFKNLNKINRNQNSLESKNSTSNQQTSKPSSEEKMIYCPKFNAPAQTFQENSEIYVNFIQNDSFGQMIMKEGENWKYVSVPFLIEDRKGKYVLVAHCSKANKIWNSFNSENECMIIFTSTHSYISPSYYQKNDVPTWNYSTLLVCGRPKIVENQKQNLETLRILADKNEKYNKTDWSLGSLSKEYVEKKMDGIVFFEIEIERVESRMKLGQNRSKEDINGVIENFEKKGFPYVLMANDMKTANQNRLN